ncbi:hypothetical protein PENSUB_4921 [Penicillium subrubescens]|uniref:Uncharacterized protein n=1 Tax=Penicillium subrubescens TaxID=1316194 RepID=A0A1Q5UB07_9EURO|nr:hypothetical protein PENSUB_4921 [Penicillium subrubescens]
MSTSPTSTPEIREMETQMAEGDFPRSQIQEAIAKSHKIMSAIYWDLNATWHMERIVAADPSLEENHFQMSIGVAIGFSGMDGSYSPCARILKPSEPPISRKRLLSGTS